ncbi:MULTISPECIES: hypothetical protein [unclassified Devosia]|uniref:hypothetical protein n=1 Tax=unclassified Devosia TaxID=196773 RepID=UPI001AD374CB|nr:MULTISPECIES: hypothetical protein [unclassified Devosia]MBN9306769.1 hypothetical protein [Devosia sp.]
MIETQSRDLAALRAKVDARDVEELIRRGRHNYYYRHSAATNLTDIEIGPPPHFDEPAEAIIDRVRKLVGTVTIPRDLSRLHPAIESLLKVDAPNTWLAATSSSSMRRCSTHHSRSTGCAF